MRTVTIAIGDESFRKICLSSTEIGISVPPIQIICTLATQTCCNDAFPCMRVRNANTSFKHQKSGSGGKYQRMRKPA